MQLLLGNLQKKTYEATLNIYENNKKFKNPTQTAGNFAEILTLQSNCERPCMRIENYRVRIFRDSGTGGGGGRSMVGVCEINSIAECLYYVNYGLSIITSKVHQKTSVMKT